MRYFFEISYVGTHYHGWQNQANATGVQEIVERSLSRILRQKITITGSGRTDTGVHCRQQFFHADIPVALEGDAFLIRLNSILPKDISIRRFFEVRAEAHARYDARERTYTYTISRRKDPFLHGRSWYFFRKLDVSAMNKVAAMLIGSHDFESFSKVKTDVNHFECTILKASWKQQKDVLILTITANRFLRGMVRALVGTMIDVGAGKTSLAGFQEIIHSKDRTKAGSNVPAEGLCLIKVKYSSRVFPKTRS